MLYALSADVVLVGSALGLVLGALIVCFLVYAACRAVRSGHEPDLTARPPGSWPRLNRYDSYRPHLETSRRDLDVMEM